MNYSRLVSSKCQVLVRTVVIFDLSFLFNQCSCLQYRHVNFRVSKPNISFSTANLTTKFASVTPPFMSHVLNYIKIFLKRQGSMNVEWMQTYKPMSPMRSNRQSHVSNREHPSRHVWHGGHHYMYVCALSWALLGPVHEINLRRAPYDLLVLMTDVISQGSGEHMRLRNLVRVSLFTNIKFEMDEDSSDVCTYVLSDSAVSKYLKQAQKSISNLSNLQKKCKMSPFNKNK